jgi:23S rRNA pseudouridine1911/1915/1917 synthase
MRISDMIVHNDHHLVALCKPGGMPVQEDQSGDASLHRLAQAYCKRDLHVLNRIDRPCSGLVLFAKSESAATNLGNQWKARTITKTYLAIINKGLAPEQGQLLHHLIKRGRKSIVCDGPGTDGTSEASLEYRIVAHLDNYDVVEVVTHTGFFHQVRAQLAAAGFPIRGDVKYGARRANKDRTICLHCRTISFVHPGEAGPMILSCPLPSSDLWNLVPPGDDQMIFPETDQTSTP